MTELRVFTRKDLQDILSAVQIANSFTHAMPQLGWEVVDLLGTPHSGWLVNMTYDRPDTFNGLIGTGRGRQELIYSGATESYVVKTAFVLLRMLVDHELMEAYTYKGRRIFNPHHTIDDLCLAADAWLAREEQ